MVDPLCYDSCHISIQNSSLLTGWVILVIAPHFSIPVSFFLAQSLFSHLFWSHLFTKLTVFFLNDKVWPYHFYLPEITFFFHYFCSNITSPLEVCLLNRSYLFNKIFREGLAVLIFVHLYTFIGYCHSLGTKWILPCIFLIYVYVFYFYKWIIV